MSLHRSRDHSIPNRPFPIGGPLEPSYVSIQCEIDTTVDMTLNNLNAKVKVIHFSTHRFLIYFLYFL